MKGNERGMTELVTGGSAAIAAIEAAGVEVVFGIPGVHTLALYDGLHGRNVRHILARHEQGAGFMADGYARATGKPGVAVIITGPGITNVSTAVGEAYADSSPVVVISSQVEREYAGKMRGNLHDLRDQSGLMGIVTKQSTVVVDHGAIAGQVFEAIQAATAGRPRPVHVEVPLDVLAQEGPFAEPELHPTYRAVPAVETVGTAAAALASAKRPIIYVGGGAVDASEPITAMAEILGAPVLCSIMGKGVVADDHPYALGHAWDPWGRENPVDALLAEADLVLVIGSKLGAQETNFWQMPLPKRMIRVDIDPEEIGLNYPNPEIGIAADARATAENIEPFLEKLMIGQRGKKVFLFATPKELYALALACRERGLKAEFAPDAYIFSPGRPGSKGHVMPETWLEECKEIFPYPYQGVYGMTESTGHARLCAAGHYHMPPWIFLALLDPDTGVAFPRSGVQTGRLALFDILATAYWGGAISGDRVTIDWNGGCPCGRVGPFMHDDIVRYMNLRDDDKITCAKSADAYAKTVDFVLGEVD